MAEKQKATDWEQLSKEEKDTVVNDLEQPGNRVTMGLLALDGDEYVRQALIARGEKLRKNSRI